MALREWTSKRNCLLSSRQMALFYASLCVASFPIAGLFAMFGMHHVFEFVLPEMVLVGVAFLIYARRAGDGEHIALTSDGLLLGLIEMERVRQFCLDRQLTQVELPSSRHVLMTLEAAGMRVEVGQFLTKGKRREFAQELKQELRHGVAAGS